MIELLLIHICHINLSTPLIAAQGMGKEAPIPQWENDIPLEASEMADDGRGPMPAKPLE